MKVICIASPPIILKVSVREIGIANDLVSSSKNVGRICIRFQINHIMGGLGRVFRNNVIPFPLYFLCCILIIKFKRK